MRIFKRLIIVLLMFVFMMQIFPQKTFAEPVEEIAKRDSSFIKRYTIEDVIFNNIPLLDINFFDFSHAGGQELAENSPIYVIRQLIAGWYASFRIIAIIFMLIVLIYLMIKAAITTAASDKAVVKERLVEWLVGFLIVFSIHYVMMGIIYFNNQVVDILKPIAYAQSHPNTGAISTTIDKTADLITIDRNVNVGSVSQNKEDSIYEKIRVMAYDIPAISGWSGTFMYVTLVVFMIIFVFMYIKRVFILAILTIISPLIGVLYAFNKAKYSITTWFKEYAYNVIIQLIHAVIYTVLIAVALDLAQTSTILGSVIAFAFMAFIFKAEEIVKRIFKYDSSTLGGLSSSVAAQLALYTTGKSLVQRAGKKIYEMHEDDRKNRNKVDNTSLYGATVHMFKESSVGKMTRDYLKRGEAGIYAATTYTSERMSRATKKATSTLTGKDYVEPTDPPVSYGEHYAKHYKALYKPKYRPSKEVSERLEKTKNYARSAKNAFVKERGAVLLNATLATAATALSVPMFILNPSRGIAVAFFGAHAFNKAFSRKTIRGKKVEKASFRGPKLLYFAISPVLAPAYANVSNNARAEYLESKRIADRVAREIFLLRRARTLENRIATEIERMYAGVPKNKGRLQSVLNLAEKTSLRKALKTSTRRYEKVHVTAAVSGCIATRGTIGLADMGNIRSRLNRISAMDGIVVTNEFDYNVSRNVRAKMGMKSQVSTLVMDQKGRTSTVLRSRIEMPEIEEVFREVAQQENIDESLVKDVMSSLKKDKKFKKSVSAQEIREITTSVSSRLGSRVGDNARQEDIRKKMEEKMNEKIEAKTQEEAQMVNDQVARMNTRQIESLILESLDMDGSVKFDVKSDDKYFELMKLTRQLDNVNTEYEELRDAPIYDDVEELVEKIRDSFLRE